MADLVGMEVPGMAGSAVPGPEFVNTAAAAKAGPRGTLTGCQGTEQA